MANLTPPAVKTKDDTAAQPVRVPKNPSEAQMTPPEVTDEPSKEKKEKKERAPKKDYGYSKDSIIKVLKPDASYKGQRGEWFNRIKEFDGKTCGEFIDKYSGIPNGKGKVYAPSGNLRGAARRGAITMIRPDKPAE